MSFTSLLDGRRKMMRLNKKAKENPPLWAEDSHFFAGIYKPNSVPSPFLRKSWAIVICLGPALLRDSSDSPSPTFRKVELDTILHRGKYLAVSYPWSPKGSSPGLNRETPPAFSSEASLFATPYRYGRAFPFTFPD